LTPCANEEFASLFLDSLCSFVTFVVKDMLLENFRPQSKLVTRTTLVEKPRFPAFDAHNHLGEDFGGGWDKRPLSQLLDLLDQAGIVRYVDLDGGWGEHILHAHLDHFKQPAPDRLLVFGGVDWSRWPDLGNAFPEWAAARLRVQKERGAEGLKIWKGLGLHVKDQSGKLVDVDDALTATVLSLAEIREMTNELFAVHQPYLPQFKTHKV
jgi:hypothetical protein